MHDTPGTGALLLPILGDLKCADGHQNALQPETIVERQPACAAGGALQPSAARS
jgi:hypothetical protein